MGDEAIPFGRPMLDNTEIEAVTRVLSGNTLVHGPVTHEFERCFAARAGAAYAVSVSSCTAGLHLSLYSLGVGRGDRVVVPAMTHVATAHAAEFCGAEPLFVDVDPTSGNLDPRALGGTDLTDVRVVMLVHFLGLPCDMDRISPIAQKSGATIVEDCAIAIDARYGETKVGTLGATGCFSFYPIKHMTTIEGGMVTTNDERLAQAIAQRKAFGYDRTVDKRTQPGIYDVTALGYNYRMNEVQAAVGLAQLGKLDAFQKIRAANYTYLKQAMSDIEEITIFEPRQGKAQSTHYCLNAVLPKDRSLDRNKIVETLRALGIGTSVHYPRAVPLMAYYRHKYGHKEGQFPVAEWLADQSISLPVGPHLNIDHMERIAKSMRQAIATAQS